MSQLRVHRDIENPHAFDEYKTFADIAREAARAQITFERWVADKPLAANATQAEILVAYDTAVQRLKSRGGYLVADVISVGAHTPDHATLRKKFLAEHTHSEDEARFFVEGAGLFFIHHSTGIYALYCEAGDLINVPAGAPHWFDFGPEPRLKCIRLFANPEGWVARHTGSPIAARYPLLPSAIV